MQPHLTQFLALTVAAACLSLAFVPMAQAETGKVSIELNKFEQIDKSCRAFIVVGNDSATEYESLRLDLWLFQADGVIGRRLAINLAPLKAAKKVVKQFDLEALACDQIGSLLVNDVLECKATPAVTGDCLAGLSFSTLTKVQLSK